MKVLIYSLAVWFLWLEPSYAQSKCQDDIIQNKVSIIVGKMDSFAEGRQALKQVDMGIKQGNIKPESRDDILSTIMEVEVRKAEGCTVPAALLKKITQALNFSSGDKACISDDFKQKAIQQFNELKASPDYKTILPAFKAQMLGSIAGDTKKTVEKRWDNDTDFREKLISLAIQASIMDQEGCSNASEPFSEVFGLF